MTTRGSEARISVRVHPGAASNQVTGVSDDVLRIRIAAPPLKGKANRELINFLSRLLNIGKDNINIIKGHTTRDKIIGINGLGREEVLRRLLAEQ